MKLTRSLLLAIFNIPLLLNQFFILFIFLIIKTFLFIKIKKNIVIDDLPIVIFHQGGIGDFIIKLNSIENHNIKKLIFILPDKMKEIVFKNKNIKVFYYRKKNFLYFLFKLKKHIEHNSLFLSFNPSWISFFTFMILNLKFSYGFIDSRKHFTSVGFNIQNKHSPVCNDSQNFNMLLSNLFDKTVTKKRILGYSKIDEIKKPFIILNSTKSDDWPAGRLNYDTTKNLIKLLLKKHKGHYIYLIGNKDHNKFNKILLKDLNYCKYIINYAGKTNFSHLFFLIDKSSFIYTTDSLISHIGKYFDKDVTTFYSFSDPQTFEWGKRSKFYINKKFNCMPCVSFNEQPLDNKPFNCPFNSRCDQTFRIYEKDL